MSSKVVQSSSVLISPLNKDEKELWELCYYAGVKMDPQVAKIVMDLLGMDIHPKAILEVLDEMAKHSKYAKVKKSKASTSATGREKPTGKVRSSKDRESVMDKPKASSRTKKSEERTSKTNLKSSSRNPSATRAKKS